MFTKNNFQKFISVVFILATLFSNATPPVAAAQTDSDGLKRQVNAQSGRVSFIGPEGGRVLSASRALGTFLRPQNPALALANRYAPEFGIKDPTRELTTLKSNHSSDGRLIVRYQQNYQGIPVMAGELIVNTNSAGDLYSMSGKISPNLALPTQSKIDSVQAAQTALQAAAKWYQKLPTDFVVSTPQLWIYDESLLQPSTRPVELVWRMEVTPADANMPMRELVLVNAQTGGISTHFNQIDNEWNIKKPEQAQKNPNSSSSPTPIPTNTPNPTETPVTQETSTSTNTFSSNIVALAAQTWYVATIGSDANSCSAPDAPCATINGAIAKSATDDTIKVASGTYTNTTGNVVTVSKGLTLSGGWNSAFTTQAGASTIDGGSIRNGILANAAGSNVVVDHFIIQNSHTGSDSGGIYIYGANFTLKNSSVINNTAGRGAGIFSISNASLVVINSTIGNNSVTLSGSGIYAVNGTVTINNSTIAHNSSNGSGGGITVESGTVSFKNSILAKNTATGSGPDCSGSLSASDHDVIGDTGGCTVSSGTGDQFNVDPLIDSALSGTLPLYVLLANSPAINAGDNNTCQALDQRGMIRPQGSTCDMGAYELVISKSINVYSGSNQAAQISSAFALPLIAYVMDDLGNPVSGVTVTFTAPASGASGMFAGTGTNITTAITDSNGLATSAVFTANNQPGGYSINAAAVNYDSPAIFNLSNTLADLYVSPSGSDANSCKSPALPCLTINGAIGKASAGNTIAVATGTYTGTGSYVVFIGDNKKLSGGWDNTFSTQSGFSIIDGQNARAGLSNYGLGSSIDHFIIMNGNSDFSGGGIASGGPLNINNSIIMNNYSTSSTGGIFASGDLTLNNSTVRGNSPTGIRIYVNNALTVNNSTISENSGGGISLSGGSGGGDPQITNIINSTITNNNAQSGAAGIAMQSWWPSRTVVVKNSIIANNISTTVGPDCAGTINTLDHSLIGNTSNCTISSGAGNLLNTDPMISMYPVGILGYHALKAGSPAIDMGADCLPADQRGITRPQGSACDMGSYEYMASGPAVSFGIAGGSNQNTSTLMPFPQPLALYVVDSSGSPVSGMNVTFTAPASGASSTFATSGTNTTTILTTSDGIADSSIFTANSQLGTYNITATVSGLPGTVNFTMTNTNWFVSKTGNDGNSCSAPATPCLTIDGAINKASSGGVIKVTSGTYTNSGSQVINIIKSLTLSGGWDNTFTNQSGYTVIDGQTARTGIYASNTSTNVTIDRFIVQNGYSASSGGGVNNNAGSLTINNSLITNNQAVGSGGGINNSTGSLIINSSLIKNNQASYGGGGIYSSGNLVIDKSTIRSNTSLYSGGGIAIYSSTISLTLNNSTVSGNQASSSGGGIALYYSYGGTPGSVIIQNSTLVNNSASSGGGISNGGGSARTLNIKNSIIANNTANSSGPDCNGIINTLDHSLLFNGSTCTLGNNTSSLLNVNPLIGKYPLGTLEYQALQSGSPAIDNGADCLPTDQRGIVRPQGSACDMGSYEYVTSNTAASFGIASGSNQRAGQLRPFSLPLVVYVTDGSGSPVGGVNVTFTAPASGASGTFSGSGTNTIIVPTNADGVAVSSIYTSNSQLGTYNIAATASSLPGSVNFVMTNVTWFVSITGNDGNSCSSPATPCLTINAAINKASNGDMVKVAVGTYTGVISPVVNITKGLILSGGWDSSFVSQTGFSVIDGSFGTFHGITSSGSNVSISRFAIKKSQYGIYHTGGTLSFDQGALIDNNNGIYNYAGNTTFTNTTISGNHGGGTAGSAISNVQGTVSILYSTITNNIGGYAIYSSNGYAYIKMGSSILAGNSSDDCYIGSNPNFSGGYNIFGNSPACSGSFTLLPTDQTNVNPRLLPLLTAGYYPILPGSPAIDSANSATCPATDQRGVQRPQGAGCDIGAFEYRGNGVTPAYIIAYAGTPQYITKGGTASSNLKAAVLDQNGDSVSGKTVTFTAPNNSASAIFTNTGTNTSTAVTDTGGIATSSGFTANMISGNYVVQATITGLVGSANFQITNGGAKAKTYTANNTTTLPGTFLCDQTTFNCTNGSNPHADAAHKYAMGTYDLYSTKHNRDSIDNNGMTIISTVHYSSGYQNAFWNGDQMVYGDGSGFPLADDVVAHELTHGVTQYESNLFYFYQSGAINESFSDVWGEYYDQTNGLGNDDASVKWLMGEDVAGIGALRSMSNPPAYGDPDKMTSYNYYTGDGDNGGVHTNSGINNKAVSLMVDGGSFNGQTITALGWDKVIAIYYEVNTNLLSSGSDYSDLYYAVQEACKDLTGQFGITVSDCQQMKNALDAVEMNAQPVANFNPDAPVCPPNTAPAPLFQDNFENGTGKWNILGSAHWMLDNSYASSPNHAMWGDDSVSNSDSILAMKNGIYLPPGATSYLHFKHAFGFESSLAYYYDGGVLEYSTNNGTTWLDAAPLYSAGENYTGTIYNTPHSSNVLKGRSAFAGDSHGYVSSRYNLAPLAGQTVKFRWRFATDQFYYYVGWAVDDVNIYNCVGDTTAPLVTSVIHSAISNPNVVSTDFVVTFSENVTGVGVNDLALATTGVTGAAISKVSGSGTTYTVTINTGKGNGTIRLDVMDNDTIVDSAGNSLGGSGAGNGNFTSGETYIVNKTMEAYIGASLIGAYTLAPSQSGVDTYPLSNGPVEVKSTNSVPVIAAERVIFAVNGMSTSYSELMGLPKTQLATSYLFPWYNNLQLNSQLRFGNVGSASTIVSVKIHGTTQATTYTLAPGESTTATFPVSDGPVEVFSDGQNIIAAERVIFSVNNTSTSYSEMMGLPKTQVATSYLFPWYNNQQLNSQLRFGNVGSASTIVSVKIHGTTQATTYTLAPGESTTATFGASDGPIEVFSDGQNIIAAERVIFAVNGTSTSYSELMGLPQTQLATSYLFPWYNNQQLNSQLRFGNVGSSSTVVSVKIHGITQATTYTLAPGESTTVTFPASDGPVEVFSDGQNIIAAERVIFVVNETSTSYSELMGLPQTQLATSYLFPWYNNQQLNSQLRFAAP